MPELPEVEMIKRVVEPQIKGLAIENIIVNRPEVIAHPQTDEFIKHLTGQKFSAMEHLAKSIPELLTFFVEKNTIAAEEYFETKGRDYRNTPFLKIYGKEGKLCPICGSILQKSVIGGRSSVFCAKCQGEL